MARKCNSPGCGFPITDKYPLDKCPWHMAPGQGPVKIAAALAIAAAGLGGGFAYKKFRAYLSEKKLRKEREERRQRDVSASCFKVSETAAQTKENRDQIEAGSVNRETLMFEPADDDLQIVTVNERKAE